MRKRCATISNHLVARHRGLLDPEALPAPVTDADDRPVGVRGDYRDSQPELAWLGLDRTIDDWQQDPGYDAAMHRALTEDLGPASDRILAKMGKRA
jgi:hypothetical protein